MALCRFAERKHGEARVSRMGPFHLRQRWLGRDKRLHDESRRRVERGQRTRRVLAMIDLGSSDAPAVLGVSPHTTPFQLYARKLGLLPDEIEDTEVMKRGLQMERLVVDMFIEDVMLTWKDGRTPPVNGD